MHFKMLSAISFNLDQSKILSSGNGLTNKAILGLLNGFGICRLQIFCFSNDEIILENSRQKRENACHQHFFSPQFFQKAFPDALTLYSIDTRFNASTTDSF